MFHFDFSNVIPSYSPDICGVWIVFPALIVRDVWILWEYSLVHLCGNVSSTVCILVLIWSIRYAFFCSPLCVNEDFWIPVHDNRQPFEWPRARARFDAISFDAKYWWQSHYPSMHTHFLALHLKCQRPNWKQFRIDCDWVIQGGIQSERKWIKLTSYFYLTTLWRILQHRFCSYRIAPADRGSPNPLLCQLIASFQWRPRWKVKKSQLQISFVQLNSWFWNYHCIWKILRLTIFCE